MKLKNIALALVAATATTAAVAAPAGTWTIGAGAAYVDPKSDASELLNNGTFVKADEDVRPSLTFEYFPAKNVGVELLLAHPFKHEIQNANGDKIGSTKLLPPTLSLQYHFDNGGKVVPFIGAGVNYTTFFDEKLNSPIELKLKDSWGAAGHVGVDFKLTDRDAIRLDARYIDLKTDAKLGDKDAGEIDLSPWVYGVSFVKSF